ncbi:hypothetical protein OEJ37_14540 [Burkholderia sp. BKH01]|uniref:hypothetical protein n=1 Tax=Burkholderia sp. BKH01 TaxID=2769262 RepID=UPI0021E0714F|nr:hypothetical protein [Burkholderia sp. BKH01]MCU9954576.1 hypothetical protein [Burkholderia sp. BKH01]
MPTIHPPIDSPSFGLQPVAKPGRHRLRFNPKISFQIQFAIRIERIKFEFQLIRFQGIVPAGAARCVTPEIHAPARSGNCQLSWRDFAFRFRMTVRRSLHGDVNSAVHLGAEDSKEKILPSNFI